MFVPPPLSRYTDQSHKPIPIEEPLGMASIMVMDRNTYHKSNEEDTILSDCPRPAP